jgi:hypothetical protein
MEQGQGADAAQSSEQAQVANAVHDSEQAIDMAQESLDRVRDILFGSQIREQDHRRQAFEEEQARQLAAFQEESRKRLESLEAFTKREIASVLDVLKTESAQRADASQALSQQLRQAIVGVEKRIATVEEQHTAEQRALRSELLDQSNALRDEVSKMGQSLTALLEKNFASLQDTKADRAVLANLFSEVAQRLGA